MLGGRGATIWGATIILSTFSRCIAKVHSFHAWGGGSYNMRATIGGATIEGATIIPGTYNSYSFHIKSLPSDKNSYYIRFFSIKYTA